jgi:hypothetical protein
VPVPDELADPVVRAFVEAVNAADRDVVSYTNSTYGTMLTNWTFTVANDKISRFQTGQA